MHKIEVTKTVMENKCLFNFILYSTMSIVYILDFTFVKSTLNFL